MTIGAEGQAAAPEVQTGQGQHTSGPQVWLWTLAAACGWPSSAAPGRDSPLICAFRWAAPTIRWALRDRRACWRSGCSRARRAGSARALQDAFDDLGVRRGGGVGPEATRIGVSGLRADLRACTGASGRRAAAPRSAGLRIGGAADLARQDLDRRAGQPARSAGGGGRRVAFRRRGRRLRRWGFAHPPAARRRAWRR